MSWESMYCAEHEAEAVLVSVTGQPRRQRATFTCPVGGETLTLREVDARDTSHLPVIEIPEPDGLDPLPD